MAIDSPQHFSTWSSVMKNKKYGHPSTARLAFRHSGTVLAGIQ